MVLKSHLEMEITKKSTIEGKEIDMIYHFFIPAGAPYGQAYDAFFEALTKITEMAKESVEQVKPQGAKEPEVLDAVPLESKK